MSSEGAEKEERKNGMRNDPNVHRWVTHEQKEVHRPTRIRQPGKGTAPAHTTPRYSIVRSKKPDPQVTPCVIPLLCGARGRQIHADRQHTVVFQGWGAAGQNGGGSFTGSGYCFGATIMFWN